MNGGECSAKFMSHTKLDRAFLDYIGRFDKLKAVGSIAADIPQPDTSQEIATIMAKLHQIEKKTQEIMGLFVANTIDFATYQGMVQLSTDRRNELEKRLNSLESVEQVTIARYDTSEIVTTIKANWQELNNEQRLQFVQKFIKKMVVHSESINGGRGNY